jgi:hypothetical protein
MSREVVTVPDCIVPGCRRDATNNLGVRLRRPPQADAHWSPNTNAFICDTHARAGARITLLYEQANNRRIETRVYAVDEPVLRRTQIGARARR